MCASKYICFSLRVRESVRLSQADFPPLEFPNRDHMQGNVKSEQLSYWQYSSPTKRVGQNLHQQQDIGHNRRQATCRVRAFVTFNKPNGHKTKALTQNDLLGIGKKRDKCNSGKP